VTDGADRRFYEFGRFRLDQVGRVLFCGDRAVPLPPKAADVLLQLVQNAGHVVERQELLKSVWQDVIVEEGSLTRTISILRKVLEDGPAGQEFISTIPTRGYRFVLPVRLVEDCDPVAKPSAIPYSADNRKIKLTSLMVVVSALALSSYFSLRWYSSRQDRLAGVRMIAVLPFQNLTGDPAQEFLTDGLTEEMITGLGALNHEQLGVIARTSAMAYKASVKPVSQIGRELGVNYILEGSVRRWGNRIRISTQLIETGNQTQVWAKNYESDTQDILKVQNDVAQAVAREISLTLAPETRARITRASRVDPLVYELCLRGRYEWNRRTEAAIKQAIYFFQQAIGRDPGYAPAYAGLADAYVVLPYYSKDSSNDTFPIVKAAAEHALELDQSLAQAHTTLGLVECTFDVAAAERHYERALELDPNYATAHHWHAFCLWSMNRQNESLAELERARQLDPLSLIIYSDEAKLLSCLHQSDRAIRLLETATRLDPNFADAHRALAVAYVQTGQIAQGIAEARRGVELDPNDYEQATLGYVYGISGKTREARAILAQFNTPGRRVAPINVSVVYAGMGRKAQALQILKSKDAHFGGPLSEPMLDSLRSNPSFENLLQAHHQESSTK
jgi:TolB-like protein/DNA-binding winged helix-turn-helix (wHTH) protein